MSDSENIPSNPRAASAQTISDLIDARLSRRTFMGGLVTAAGVMLTGCARPEVGMAEAPSSAAGISAFSFPEITRGIDGDHHVPEGYTAEVLLRWGDPLFDTSAPEFDAFRQTEKSQLERFGYNNDYVGFVPIEDDRGLLCVNHEFTSTLLMFPEVASGFPDSVTLDHCLIEMAAHGGSVVELKREDGRWQPVIGSEYNRRITPHRTPMQVTGPAAGHDRMKTSEDSSGKLVSGTMNNCAGGITPWGTWLMAEENFNGYFFGELPTDHPESENHKRYGIPGTRWLWGRFVDQFNLEKEPNEPNRFGWVVEVDPKDPKSIPRKRTALGRFKHEGAESVIAPDGRLVVYMGDDQRFDYVYKFVSRDAVRNDDSNSELLDHGTLYVARFADDGFLDWLPLTYGEGPLVESNGFSSQGEVLIETRRAADLLGATPMDRPEDVQPDPNTGRVWVMLTNNSERQADQVDAANPRAKNETGHIIEIVEPEGDFAATRSRWEILVQCGDPEDASVQATWNPATSSNGWFGSPDNAALDSRGRLWVATDGNEKTGANDGLWAVETDGERRGTGRAFFRAPSGAEVCGPLFTPDSKTLFLAVQHPGGGWGSTFENPKSRWPDFEEGKPPRPSVVAIRRDDGELIG